MKLEDEELDTKDYFIYNEYPDLGVPIKYTIDDYKIRMDICHILDKKRIDPYYFVLIFDDNEKCIKVTKISAIKPKYIYVKNILEKPNKIEILTDEEIDRIISLFKNKEYYKESLYWFNMEESEDEYEEIVNINREVPDYSLLKTDKEIEIIDLKFCDFFEIIRYKLLMLFRR